MPTKDRSGWAYGECVGSDEWLTIMGSAHRRPVLHGTQAEAEAALAGEPYRNNPHLNLVVRHVTEVPHSGVSGGRAYQITQVRRVVNGTVIEHEGDTYQVVLTYPADGRLLPVMAIRTENGVMAPGWPNLAAFMLDAAAAAAGRVVVVAKRESTEALAVRFLVGERVRNTQSGTFGVVTSPDGLESHVRAWPGEDQVCVWWQGTTAPSWTFATVVMPDPLFPEGP